MGRKHDIHQRIRKNPEGESMIKSHYENFKQIVEHMKKHRSKKYKLIELNEYNFTNNFEVHFIFEKKNIKRGAG